jgi:hypothetical protein
MEPYRKRHWKKASSPERIAFYTCARPGRSLSKTDPVPDQIVHKWVRGLPGPNTTILSLLGHKPDGTSEFTFYTFHSQLDTPGETRRGKSFQEWLDHHHADRGINVVEYPTTDYQGVPQTTLTAIAADVNRLLTDGRTVVLVDSGGQQRTGTVCKYLGLIEDTRS